MIYPPTHTHKHTHAHTCSLSLSRTHTHTHTHTHIPIWQTTSINLLCWFTASFTYYGLALNTGNLAGDFYSNFCINMAVDVPALILSIPMFDKLGRARTLSITLILGESNQFIFVSIRDGMPISVLFARYIFRAHLIIFAKTSLVAFIFLWKHTQSITRILGGLKCIGVTFSGTSN